MANFKVGDRVRVVADNCSNPRYVGREGTVVDTDSVHRGHSSGERMPYQVALDGYPNDTFFAARHIAPLTPPAEDAWAADAVRKVTKPQHVEPVAPERVGVVGGFK
jgi:hypothetical protein